MRSPFESVASRLMPRSIPASSLQSGNRFASRRHETREVATGGRLGYRHRRGLACELTAPANIERAELRQRNGSGAAAPAKGAARVFGALLAALLFERRIGRALLEEVQERDVEVPERLLDWHDGDRLQPSRFLGMAKFGQLRGGLVVADGSASVEGVSAHPQPPIVDVAAGPEHVGESCLLRLCRIESKADTAASRT